MYTHCLFVIILFKSVTAGFGDIFDWNFKIPGFDSFLHPESRQDSQDNIDSDLLDKINKSATDNLYFLYTSKNPLIHQVLHFNNASSIEASNFNPKVPTVVLAHGWTGNQNANLNPVLRDAFLTKSDVNVIVLDWCRLSYSNYVTSAAGVPLIGQGLGMFLSFLNSLTGISYDQMHLVGHSLGAHVVGNAGRDLGGKIGRITALDPAGPLWYFNPYRISKDDAIYVEVIHTNAGFSSLGIGWEVGHVDFYPNGGSSQPGCNTKLCNHNRACELFAATIISDHLIGKKCASKMHMTMDVCDGQQFPMGNTDLKKAGSGIYRLNTNMFYPYTLV